MLSFAVNFELTLQVQTALHGEHKEQYHALPNAQTLLCIKREGHGYICLQERAA